MATFKFIEGLAEYCVIKKKMSEKQLYDIAMKMPLFDSANFQAVLSTKYDKLTGW